MAGGLPILVLLLLLLLLVLLLLLLRWWCASLLLLGSRLPWRRCISRLLAAAAAGLLPWRRRRRRRRRQSRLRHRPPLRCCGCIRRGSLPWGSPGGCWRSCRPPRHERRGVRPQHAALGRWLASTAAARSSHADGLGADETGSGLGSPASRPFWSCFYSEAADLFRGSGNVLKSAGTGVCFAEGQRGVMLYLTALQATN